MGLADNYHLGRELIDQEPNRSVQIRRRIDTRIPNPLLSAAVSPPPSAVKPALGNLASLRTTSNAPASSTGGPAPVWGKSTNPGPSKPSTGLTPNSSHPSLATLAKNQAIAEATGSGANTPRHSRPVTPNPPVLEVKGKVGEVDEVDWDED